MIALNQLQKNRIEELMTNSSSVSIQLLAESILRLNNEKWRGLRVNYYSLSDLDNAVTRLEQLVRIIEL